MTHSWLRSSLTLFLYLIFCENSISLNFRFLTAAAAHVDNKWISSTTCVCVICLFIGRHPSGKWQSTVTNFDRFVCVCDLNWTVKLWIVCTCSTNPLTHIFQLDDSGDEEWGVLQKRLGGNIDKLKNHPHPFLSGQSYWFAFGWGGEGKSLETFLEPSIFFRGHWWAAFVRWLMLPGGAKKVGN